MKSYIFRVMVEEDVIEEGGKAYHASCPALKGCHTWGHTYAEALTNIREAIKLYARVRHTNLRTLQCAEK